MNPNPPDWYYEAMSQIYIMAERYDDALAPAQECVARIPGHIWCQQHLTIVYMALGQLANAQRQAKELLNINPDILSENYVVAMKDPEHKVRYVSLLRQAGIP